VNKIEALLTRIAEDETLPKLAKEPFAQYRQPGTSTMNSAGGW
jgi:hypothetical protein